MRAHSYSYDTLGRPSAVALTVGISTHTVTTGYDAASRVSTVAYPSGFTVAYGYNATGYQAELRNAATDQLYWAANTRDAEGHLTAATAGNGLVTTQSFEATTGRLTGISSGPSGAVQDFAYSYDGPAGCSAAAMRRCRSARASATTASTG